MTNWADGLLGAALAALLALAAREVWCHWYYPARARLHQVANQPEEALLAWRAYLNCRTLLPGGKLAARLAAAGCLHRLRQFAAALAEGDELLRRSPGDLLRGYTERLRADCLRRLGRGDEARAALDAAIAALERTEAGRFVARELRVDRRELDGDWQGALSDLEALLREALTTAPDSLVAAFRLRLARRRLELGDVDAAVMGAEALLSRSGLPPEINHDAHLVSARGYLAQGRLQQAQRDAEAAFRQANQAYDTERLSEDCQTLAEIAAARGDFVEAMRQLQRVRECGGDGRWRAALGEAELLAAYGRRDEARRALDQATAALEAGQPAAGAAFRIALARAELLLDDDPAAALETLRPWLDTPLSEPLPAARRDALVAIALTRLGDLTAAPWRGRLAAARGAGAPPAVAAWLDWAAAECALAEGRPEAAVEPLRAALDQPGDPLRRPALRLRLGDLLAELGRRDEARAVWREAAETDLDLPAVAAARARLAGRDEPG